MRFLIRLVVLALAALGAKALYDLLALRRDELASTGADLVARTKTAAREVVGTVSDATKGAASAVQESATAVASSAAEQASEVKAAAADARDEVKDTLTTDADADADDAVPPAKRSTAKSAS